MSGLGATADIGRRYALGGSVAFDPSATKLIGIAALLVGPMVVPFENLNGAFDLSQGSEKCPTTKV